MISLLRSLVDWKRLILALPLLLAIGAGTYYLLDRGGPSASTPRAALAETPPGAVEKVGVQRGQLARDFVGTAPDGSVVRLSDLRGRPTIINFWATWCTSCLAELPEFKEVQREIGVENLNIVAVNTGEDASTAQKWVERLGLDAFHITLDPTLVVSDAYGVSGMPTSVFLDADGVVRATYVGQLDKALLREYLAAAQTGNDADEPPAKLRLITTVARDHTLEIFDRGGATVELRSKSLRCDESYCSEEAIRAFARSAGVISIERRLSEDPASIVVEFDAAVTSAQALSEALAEALNAAGDPLYERPLEIIEGKED